MRIVTFYKQNIHGVVLQHILCLNIGRLRGLIGSLILSVALFTAVPVYAFDQCPASQFGVAGIKIDQSAETAAKAQIEGVGNAARLGFARVLYRLLRDDTVVDQFLSENSPEQFVDFFHISEENSIAGRYIAVLDYCFDARSIRAAFRAVDLEWAELQSPKILVLPVWLAPDGARAWQTDNDWLSGWREAVAGADGLVDFTLLEPTILNERSLRAEDLAKADPATLRRAAIIAGADQIMLVTARLDYKGSQPVLAVDGQLFTAAAEQLLILGKMVDRPVGNDLQSQLGRARQLILGEMERGWHAANIIRGNEMREITVDVPILSLTDWAKRRDAFDQLAVIDSYIVRRLDIGGALVTLSVVGNDAAIANSLAAHNLRLRKRDDGSNVIEPQ
ncbi:DUF2066 domain-containing protein [Alphaproteobacteria bacterium]|jgi:hypothetical protein|nr:DUF2066 domain-containing protein [Alphaproteobacteria bacterium]NCF48664.1 DUF2066 domain-containing protein [Bacteroidota bacterium]